MTIADSRVVAFVPSEYLLQNYAPIPEAGCWIWLGAWNKCGYGTVVNNSKYIGDTHRIFYEAHKGEIPEGAHVCHKCDTRSCVNPDHLFLGSMHENMKDMARKGRSTHGVRNPMARLSESDVIEIFQSAEDRKVLSARFGIQTSQIATIQNRRQWKRVTANLERRHG